MAPDDIAEDDASVTEAAAQASLAEDMLALTRVMFGLSVPLAVAPSHQQPIAPPTPAAPQSYADAAVTPPAAARPAVPPAAPPVPAVPLPDTPTAVPVPDAVPPSQESAPTPQTPGPVPVPAGIPVPNSPLAAPDATDDPAAESPGGEEGPRPEPTAAPVAIPVPDLAPAEPDSTPRDDRPRRSQAKRSLELLQEIAFLDE